MKRETFLAPQEFQQLFGCTKEEFVTWPAWRKMARKRELNLF